MEVIHKIGRRKSAVARVYISKGKGKILTNGFGGLEESTAILDRSIDGFK